MNLDEAANVCLSGGADGADLQWGVCAGLAGHLVIHFAFAGHRSKAPEQEITRLSPEQLDEADLYVRRAAKTLKKHPPNKPWVANLIRRNWYQVAHTERVYAVSTIKDGLVQGGTAWAVQMFIDRLAEEGRKADGLLHCYDQAVGLWFSRMGDRWVQVEEPVMPFGVWTGIGTRELQDNGKWAIRRIMRVQDRFRQTP